MYTVAAHAESRLIVASMYSPGLAPSGQLTSRTVAQCTSEEVTAAMAVAPDFRGRGVGKHVMKIVLEEAALRRIAR